MTPEVLRVYKRDWMRRWRRSRGVLPWAERPKKAPKPRRVKLSIEERRWRQKERYQRLRVELIEYQKRWALENPEKHQRNKTLARRQREARKRATRTESRISYRRILTRDGAVCGICGGFLDIINIRSVHFDHIVPLARGGAHSEANIQAAHPLCNLRKQASVG